MSSGAGEFQCSQLECFALRQLPVPRYILVCETLLLLGPHLLLESTRAQLDTRRIVEGRIDVACSICSTRTETGDRAEEAVRILIQELGEDVNREGILKTPKRCANLSRLRLFLLSFQICPLSFLAVYKQQAWHDLFFQLAVAYRYAKAMRFFTQGYQQDLDVLLNKAIFTEDSDEMVLLRNIVSVFPASGGGLRDLVI
jgi:hypothetical protein